MQLNFKSYSPQEVWNRFYRIGYSFTKDHYLAEEIAQNSYLVFHPYINKSREAHPNSSFEGLIYTIAKNQAINLLNSRERESKILDFSTEKLNELEDNLLSNEDIIKSIEYADSIMKVVQSYLNPPFDEIFYLTYCEDLSCNEVADRLKIPPGTVQSRLFRARKYIISLFKKGEQDIKDIFPDGFKMRFYDNI